MESIVDKGMSEMDWVERMKLMKGCVEEIKDKLIAKGDQLIRD